MHGQKPNPSNCSRWMALILLLLAGFSAAGAAADTLVIDGGTVHPVTSEPFVGRVVITDGIIQAVGADVPLPPAAERIDATGLQVYPGFFDALSQVGLVEIGAVSATDDRSEMGLYNPHLQAITAVHPASEVIPVTRANGITHALVAPRVGRDGVIAGQAGLLQLDGWTVEEMVLDPALAMVLRWPAIQTRSFDLATFSFRETPYGEAKEKAEQERRELGEWFEAARHYAQAMEAGSQRLERDLKLEALAAVVEGRQPVIFQADEKRDIESAIAFAEKQGVSMILAGGREAWRVKEMLAERGIAVILGFTQSLPREEDDPYDRPFGSAAELAAAGVEIAFASGAGGGFGPGGPHSSRTLPWEAAMAVAYGLPREEAIKALTLYPAEILGVADRFGSIEPGKVANLIVTDGDPLEIPTRVRHLVIGGREVSTDNKHNRLYELYRGR